MDFKLFFKEKVITILLLLFGIITIEIFLMAYNVGMFIKIYIPLIIMGLYMISIIIEYFKRKKFYDNLLKILEELDEKYLITEIIKTPNFLEGKIFKNTLEQIDKSMLENVNKYKYMTEDYKEYIELWIHEIKIPIATSKMVIENNKNAITKSIDEELDKVENYIEQALFYARSNTVEKDYYIRKVVLKEIVNESGQSERIWAAKLNWNISRGDGLVGCNLEYERQDGTLGSKYISVDETTTELDNFKANGILRYNSIYKPTTTSLDEFVTEYKEVTLPSQSYIGITKDLTSLYIKNAGYPFRGYDVNNKWGKPYDWKWNEVMETKNANGGAGFTEYNDGTIQFETTQWSQGYYDNGKIWQTFTLPEGKYEMRIEVKNAANIGSGSTNIHFAVAQGESLPDNEELEKSDIILSYLKFESEHTNKTSALPIFELTEEKTITVGWVVSFSDICRNIEFKSVRLWSVAE